MPFKKKKYGNKDYSLVDTDMIFGLGKHASPDTSHNTHYRQSSIRQQEASLGITIAVFGALGFAAYWVAGILENNTYYSFPYKPVAWFYDYTLVVPVKSVPKVWHWLSHLNLTSWSALNTTISIVGVIAYTWLAIILYYLWIETLASLLKGDNTASNYEAAWSLFLFPAMFALIWFIIASLFSWLF